MTDSKGRFSRLWLVALAVAGSLVAMELFLQGAALVTQGFSQRSEGAVGAGATILCVGDSHTFGLPLPEADSYPSQLQARLDERYGIDHFNVVNLGIPSVNSAFVLHRLERQINQMDPQLIIVWVGINNLWNAVESEAWRRDDPSLSLRRALQRSKLFRLASIAWFTSVGHQYDASERGGWFEGEQAPSGIAKGRARLPHAEAGLRHDLIAMGELARSMELPILFVAYPLETQQGISHTIETSAGELGAPVLLTVQDLDRARRDGLGWSDLIDERAGPHPSAVLYRYIVESMLREVESIFAAWYDDLIPHQPVPREATSAEATQPNR